MRTPTHHTSRIETRIVSSLIGEFLVAGLKISVDDGESPESTPSSDRTEIENLLMETDEDRVHVWEGDGQTHIGWVHLVYGNDGFDVISDYTLSVEKLMTKTAALAQSLDPDYAR